jgi:ribonuclease BN (tRNA processing enzyme)
LTLVKVRILGSHCIESAQTKLPGLLIDGVMSLDAGSLTSSLTLEEQKSITSVLLTHHHFDHCRDLVTLCMNLSTWKGRLAVYALPGTIELVTSRLLDGVLYVNYSEFPTRDRPSIIFKPIETFREFQVDGYSVMAVPVKHAVPSVGYKVSSRDGRNLFYTGDTGPGFIEEAFGINPQVLITEVTAPDSLEQLVVKPGHLTPSLLKGELLRFRASKGYFPSVFIVHVSPLTEATIRRELDIVASELEASIEVGQEGQVITV